MAIPRYIDGKWQITEDESDIFAKMKLANAGQYQQPVTKPGGAFNATYAAPAAQPAQAAPAPSAPAPAAALSPYVASANPNSGVSSTLADLLKQQNTVAPQTNQFADS